MYKMYLDTIHIYLPYMQVDNYETNTTVMSLDLTAIVSYTCNVCM